MVTPIYAALMALFFIYLSARIIKQRVATSTGIGNGGDSVLTRRVRAHANFAEFVPLCLILMFFVEEQLISAHHNTGWLHLFGITLLIGRIIHAYGISAINEKLIFRQIGMITTFSVLFICSAYLLLSALF